MAILGSCLCGAVRFEVEGALGSTGNCHCSMCRKRHGAAYVTWSSVRPEQFRWTAGESHVRGFESSPGTERVFCGICGTPIASVHAGRVTELVLGTVDGDPGVRPDVHIFAGSKATWHEITDDLVQYDQWPPGDARS